MSHEFSGVDRQNLAMSWFLISSKRDCKFVSGTLGGGEDNSTSPVESPIFPLFENISTTAISFQRNLDFKLNRWRNYLF